VRGGGNRDSGYLKYISMDVLVYTTRIHTHILMYIHTYVYIYTYIYMGLKTEGKVLCDVGGTEARVGKYQYVHVIYIYTYIYICTYIHINIYIHILIYI